MARVMPTSTPVEELVVEAVGAPDLSFLDTNAPPSNADLREVFKHMQMQLAAQRSLIEEQQKLLAKLASTASNANGEAQEAEPTPRTRTSNVSVAQHLRRASCTVKEVTDETLREIIETWRPPPPPVTFALGDVIPTFAKLVSVIPGMPWLLNWIRVQQEMDEDIPLEESVWGVVMLIGTRPVGRASSSYITFLFLINVCNQLLYIYIIAKSSLTTPNYDETSVEQLRTWRRNTAHDIKYYDPITTQSLAVRVCEKDLSLEVSGRQVTLVQQTNEYLSHGNTLGNMMAQLALFAWYLTLSQEVRSCLTTLKVRARKRHVHPLIPCVPAQIDRLHPPRRSLTTPLATPRPSHVAELY